MDRPTTRPDAVIFSEGWKEGNRASSRYLSLVIIAETLLQLDWREGERAHVHRQGCDMCFATMTPGPKPAKCPHPLDNLMFPKDHPLADTPRHAWFPNEDGSQSGYLVDEARQDMQDYDDELARKAEAAKKTIDKMRKTMREINA